MKKSFYFEKLNLIYLHVLIPSSVLPRFYSEECPVFIVKYYLRISRIETSERKEKDNLLAIMCKVLAMSTAIH